MQPTIAIAPKTIARVLLWVVGVIMLLSLLGQIANHIFGYGRLMGYVPLTDVNGEANIPAWFSSAMLLTCGALLGAIALLNRAKGDRFTRHWGALSLVFCLLSLDETAELHERLIAPLRTGLNATGFLYSTWILVGGALVGLLALSYFRFLKNLPPRSRNLFLISAGIYIGGAIAVEAVHGYYLYAHGRDFGYAVIAMVEESMEMFGLIAFIYTLLTHLAWMGAGQIQLAIQSPQAAGDRPVSATEAAYLPVSQSPTQHGLDSRP